jgi:hypothetical protein
MAHDHVDAAAKCRCLDAAAGPGFGSGIAGTGGRGRGWLRGQRDGTEHGNERNEAISPSAGQRG